MVKNCLECNIEFNKPNNKNFCSKNCSNKNKGDKLAKNNIENGLVKTQKCLTCNIIKSLHNFSYSIKNNFSSPRMLQCKRCGANKREIKKRNKSWKNNALNIMFNNSKQRAKKSGLEHSITKEDIIIPDFCPVFNIKLKREDKNTWLNAPSIDRIDNTKGYIKGNVIVVSRRANILKKDATIEELIKMADFYKRYKV